MIVHYPKMFITLWAEDHMHCSLKNTDIIQFFTMLMRSPTTCVHVHHPKNETYSRVHIFESIVENIYTIFQPPRLKKS